MSSRCPSIGNDVATTKAKCDDDDASDAGVVMMMDAIRFDFVRRGGMLQRA